MKKSIVLRTDSYKFGHFKQYPANTTKVFSYIESRGGKYEKSVFFGLQYLIKEYLTKPVTMEEVEYARERTKAHGVPFNYDGWKYIVEELGGKLPLKIRAVREGTIMPVKNVMVTMENTDDKCYWLTSYVETLLLKVWYPITVATTSKKCKNIIQAFLAETADSSEGLPFKLHDFGYRGVSSEESAAIGGAAHLVNFMGTDTFNGIEFLTEHYGADMAGFSIQATEHSTVTSHGREGEFGFYEKFLDLTKGDDVAACVSDSYNIYEAIKMWGQLKDKIIENGTTLVVRPDSGDPISMSLECCQHLDREFGSIVNKKGFKLLNNVRVIYGDGIGSPEVIRKILLNLTKAGYSADNLAFGMGGGLLQKCDRDTMQFAMKCSAIIADGKFIPVYKEPITDPGKNSKKGFLDLIVENGEYKTIEKETSEPLDNSELITYYENGELLVNQTLEEIRNLAK
ncbi:nicotinate phosphoribosyltransferase [Candidatus Pacearchaeota archaeon]|nr:nicotinate phosphoribosyltransferase [Candidatus Pacearchaeota archaeon]